MVIEIFFFLEMQYKFSLNFNRGDLFYETPD